MQNKTKIYIDCEGSIDFDTYLKKEDIPALSGFLRRLGYEVEVLEYQRSFETGRPFRPNKPSIKKYFGREVNWNKAEVIEEVLKSKQSDKIILKKALVLSGKNPEKSKATGFTIQAAIGEIHKAYCKWKEENNIIETNENRNELIKKFAPIYIEIVRKKRQKRLPKDTKVKIVNENMEGIIIDYNKKDGYWVKKTDGFCSWYKRNEIMVLGNGS